MAFIFIPQNAFKIYQYLDLYNIFFRRKTDCAAQTKYTFRFCFSSRADEKFLGPINIECVDDNVG